jgi:hypothetical protein
VPGTKQYAEDGGWVATGCPNMWCAARNDPAYAAYATPHDVLTDDARSAKMTLERIHNAYNHDGSEIQSDYFDVRYYGSIEFESPEGARFRAADRERLAARKVARDNAEPVALYVNHTRTGRQVHVAVQTAAAAIVLACGARVGRYSMGSRAELGELPITCTRCAKHAS